MDYDKLTLNDVLERFGKLKFPCYLPRLRGKGNDRYLEYRIFNGLRDPFHKATVLLANIYSHNIYS